MAYDTEQLSRSVSRRTFLLTSGVVGTTALAGCLGGGSGGGNQSSSDTQGTSTLTGDGSSTVFPITNTGASYWNSNPEPGDKDYWPNKWAKQEYNTEMRLADFFANKYGYKTTGKRSKPPFRVSIALSHSGTGIEGVMDGRVDIGNSSASAKAELAGKDVSNSEMEKFVDHVVGVDGQPIVVSKAIKDAGVSKITLDQLKKIYRKKITNWSEVGGPDKDILALGRATGSGTDTAFRSNVYGDPKASISPDQRYGKNQQLQQAVSQADNAIAYMALAFVQPDGQVPPIGLEIDGTLYEHGKNLGSKKYPLSRDLHAYTWEDTSKQEAAFLNFVLSDFGQEMFVKGSNYFALPKDRLKTQRKKVKPSNYE